MGDEHRTDDTGRIAAEPTLRPARLADHDDVRALTADTWPERGDDYLPRVFPDWIETAGARTLVAEVDGTVVGIAQCVLLSPYEAWCQGMRVHPDHRGRGIGLAITHGLFDWARERGATVARNMVFSWNEAGLGQSRAAGFEPTTAFRWAHPEPDADASPGLAVSDEPDLAWTAWTASEARTALAGLALDPDETWALSELTRERLHRAADETAVLAVVDDGVRGTSFRVRVSEREGEDGTVTRLAEYGVGAWTDAAAGRALLEAIAVDAASVEADETRVLIPETPRFVSDAAYARVRLADEPDFVLTADLTVNR